MPLKKSTYFSCTFPKGRSVVSKFKIFPKNSSSKLSSVASPSPYCNMHPKHHPLKLQHEKRRCNNKKAVQANKTDTKKCNIFSFIFLHFYTFLFFRLHTNPPQPSAHSALLKPTAFAFLTQKRTLHTKNPFQVPFFVHTKKGKKCRKN